jgi:hypothetical protein
LDGVFRGTVPGGLFAEPWVGCINPGAIDNDDLNWFKAAMLQKGAARAMLNIYRAYLDSREGLLITGEGAEEVWE